MRTVNTAALEERHLKALIYGPSGTGKTNFGVSAPNPLILLSEHHAVPHIIAAAKRLGRPTPSILLIETLDDYRQALIALRGDKEQPFRVRDKDGKDVLVLQQWPETAVVDSLTEATELVTNEIRFQSPPKIGKDGLPVDSERFWNVLSERCMKLIRAFRDLPMNVLFLALLDERKIGEGDEETRWIGPMMPMRKLPSAVQAAVNVVGITYRKRAKVPDAKTGERTLEYGIATTGPDYYQLKPFRPLRDYEVTDFSSWCARINGIDDGSKAPEPMDAIAANTAAASLDAVAKEVV